MVEEEAEQGKMGFLGTINFIFETNSHNFYSYNEVRLNYNLGVNHVSFNFNYISSRGNCSVKFAFGWLTKAHHFRTIRSMCTIDSSLELHL